MPFPSRFACLHPEYVLNQILICQITLRKTAEEEDDVYARASAVWLLILPAHQACLGSTIRQCVAFAV